MTYLLRKSSVKQMVKNHFKKKPNKLSKRKFDSFYSFCVYLFDYISSAWATYCQWWFKCQNICIDGTAIPFFKIHSVGVNHMGDYYNQQIYQFKIDEYKRKRTIFHSFCIIPLLFKWFSLHFCWHFQCMHLLFACVPRMFFFSFLL